MSIEESALRLLQDTAVKAHGVRNNTSSGEKPLLFVPKGIEVVDAEQYQPGRFRYRGSFTTEALPEFISYTKSRAVDEGAVALPQVFVDSDLGTAKAFFNLGSPFAPGHGDDTASLRLTKTAAYEDLVKYTSRSWRQKELAEFLEDWFDCLTPLYLGDDAPTKVSVTAAVAAIRDITISKQSEVSNEERDLAASRSSFASIEAKSKNRLPSGFSFVCQPYAGFEDRTFNLRLSVAHDDKGPLLALRIVQKSDIAEQIAKEFEEKVRSGLPSINVYRGMFTPNPTPPYP